MAHGHRPAGRERTKVLAPDGGPQNNPVGFAYNGLLGTVDIFGFNLGATRKFKNLRSNPNVALVVDDLVSTSPWEVRGLEIRGVAEPLGDAEPPLPGMSRQVIRIHPRRIISWSVNPQAPGMVGRNVADQPRVA